MPEHAPVCLQVQTFVTERDLPHCSDAFPSELWEKTSLLSAAQAKSLGPPALSLVSLLKLREH